MFDRSTLDTYQNATPNGSGSGPTFEPPEIKRRKKPMVKARFALLNALIIPPGVLAVVPIAGEGIRNLLDVTATKLYRLPMPLLDRLEMYSGWDSLDLAHVVSALLIIATTLTWIRVINEAKGFGQVMSYQSKMPVLFYFYATVAAGVICLDALVFFLGIQARADGWGEVPIFAAPACTVLYVVLCASFGIAHSDYATGKRV